MGEALTFGVLAFAAGLALGFTLGDRRWKGECNVLRDALITAMRSRVPFPAEEEEP